MFTLRLSVRPSASARRLTLTPDGRLRVHLNSPPEKGRANKELVRYLAGIAGVPKSSIKITSGEKAREKALLIKGVTEEAFYEAVRSSGG